MQANIGRTAVQAFIFGNGDLKRRVPAEPQRAGFTGTRPGTGTFPMRATGMGRHWSMRMQSGT